MYVLVNFVFVFVVSTYGQILGESYVPSPNVAGTVINFQDFLPIFNYQPASGPERTISIFKPSSFQFTTHHKSGNTGKPFVNNKQLKFENYKPREYPTTDFISPYYANNQFSQVREPYYLPQLNGNLKNLDLTKYNTPQIHSSSYQSHHPTHANVEIETELKHPVIYEESPRFRQPQEERPRFQQSEEERPRFRQREEERPRFRQREEEQHNEDDSEDAAEDSLPPKQLENVSQPSEEEIEEEEHIPQKHQIPVPHFFNSENKHDYEAHSHKGLTSNEEEHLPQRHQVSNPHYFNSENKEDNTHEYEAHGLKGLTSNEEEHLPQKHQVSNPHYINSENKEDNTHEYEAHGHKGLKDNEKEHHYDENEKGEFGNNFEAGKHGEKGHNLKNILDESGHYQDRKKEGKRKKGAKFAEKQGHKKGHKTKGYHNKFFKDEYHKEHKFYDDYHKSGKFNKFGNFNAKHLNDKGAYKKGGKEDAAHHADTHGKKGGFIEGHYEKEDQGFDNKEGGEKYHKHYKNYGIKGGNNSGKAYGFRTKK